MREGALSRDAPRMSPCQRLWRLGLAFVCFYLVAFCAAQVARLCKGGEAGVEEERERGKRRQA